MEDRANILREMDICRFCLSTDSDLTSIYQKETDAKQQTVPLPLQIMACVAIEVFQNDGMPQLICSTCRLQTQQAYVFKTTCKKSDDALKLFLATGNLIKPAVPERLVIQQESRKQAVKEQQTLQQAKRLRTSEPQVITPKHVQTPKAPTPAPQTHHKIEFPEDTITDVLIADEEMEEDEEEETDDEDADTMNPVLTVPQVPTDVFPCRHCERSFPLKQLLDIHMKNHDRERTFVCDSCGHKFFTKYDLAKHSHTHSGDKPFTCVVCEKSFSRESLLHRHEKIHVDVPKYLCADCDRTFLTKEDLDQHSEKHKKRRPYACRLCTKSFVFKQGLERHELSHQDQKPHKCNYCEASFTSPIKLTRHITSHAGLRPYPCKMCGRTFLLSHHLTRHMRSHYAAKSAAGIQLGQFKCDVCSMSFRRKDSLINHSAIHSMVNLKCVICNTAFDNAKMVKEHITTHLSGLPYPCDKCDYSFDTQDQLEEHELKHAEMEYEDQIEKEVSMEAQHAVDGDDDELDDDEEDDDDDDVTEYTITNPENPELIRRSRREPKVKNYADFLKDELGSDLEDEDAENTEEEEMEDIKETIKPVVRQEGTKVYTRKSIGEKPRSLPQTIKAQEAQQPTPVSLDQITQPPPAVLKQEVAASPNKTFVDMKIGDKTVRVQKLMMSKAEIEAMAREGKIEMKGSTILLKSGRGVGQNSGCQKNNPLANVNIDQIIDHSKSLVPIPKTQAGAKLNYARRSENSDAPITLNTMPMAMDSNGQDEESYTLELDETV